AEQSHRILHEVWHHQRDARAARQPGDILEIARERARSAVELAVGHRPAHADTGGAVAIALDARGEEIADRSASRRVDVRRHTLRVGLQPDPFHDILSYAL